MKTVMFSFMKDNPGTVIPSTRIARHVASTLKCETYFMDPKIAEAKADVLVIINGAYAFCKVLEELSHAIRAAKRIVWIQNDYTIIPPINDGSATSPFRRAFVERREKGKPHMEFWTTCRKLASATPLSQYVNWNALTWDPYPEAKVRKLRTSASDDLFYYGSYRHVATGNSTRQKYFDRYLSTREIPITISSPGLTTEPNKKFVERFPHATHAGKFKGDLREELARHGSGLYIEDIMSHKEFHSPANRLYEMASAGLPIIFQIESVSMLKQAGIDVQDWFALTEGKLVELHKRRNEIGHEQQKMMRKIDHLGMMNNQFNAARAKLHEAMS